MKSNAERVREWRAKHREVNRERQRGYQAWQRAKVKAASSLNAPSPVEVEPAPVVKPEPVPAAPALGNASRLAALLARGRSTLAGPAPADLPDDPAPAVPAMTQRQWARLDPDARVRWVRLNLPNITDDDELAEWLATLPK